MNIALIDDDSAQLNRIHEICRQFAEKTQLLLDCDCFDSGEAFIKALKTKQYGIALMDIFINGKNGVETSKVLRTIDRSCILIFVTSSTDFMPDAFNCHAYEYIIKPYTAERVLEVLSEAVKSLPVQDKYIELVSERRTVRLPLGDIVSAVTDAHYINVWLADDRCIKCRLTAARFLELSGNDERFIPINKGIIVNADYIENVEDNCCVLTNDFRYPIRVRKRAEIIKAIPHKGQ